MRQRVRTGLSIGLGIVFAAVASAASAKDTPAVAPPALRPVAVVAAEVDARVLDAWTGIGLEGGPAAPDAEFLRRASLDIAGRLPTADEVRAFLADTSNDKRQALVDRLLDDPTAALHFGESEARWLLGRDDVRVEHRRALEDWLARQWRDKRPYDEIVSDLVTATGEIPENGAAAYAYQYLTDVPALAGRTARLFLGVRIECAQCHDHPWDRWKESDFHAFSGFFTNVRRQKVPTPVDLANALNARARRLDAAAKQGIQKLEKNLAAAKKKTAELVKAVAAAKKALAPHRQALARVEKPWKAAVARTTKMEEVVVRAAAIDAAVQARAKTKLPPAVLRHVTEQVKIATELKALAVAQAKEATASRDTWAQRLEEAQKKAKPKAAPLEKKLQAAQAAHAKARKTEQTLAKQLEAAKEVAPLASELQATAKALAGLMPAVYNDCFASKKARVPPAMFRVLDAAGKVRARPDKQKPSKGDGLPRPLEGEALKVGVDAKALRTDLAAWLTADTNPWLAKATVNRQAARLLGRPFIDPVDDLTGPGERFAEDALALLAEDFRASGLDLRRLTQILTRTRAYGLASAEPADGSTTVVTAPVRELGGPVAFRALIQAALPGLAEAEAGGPRDLRELNVRKFASYFDDGLDRSRVEPQGGIQRALWILNGEPAKDLLRRRKEGLASRVVEADRDDEQAVTEVFLTVLGRPPEKATLAAATGVLPPKPKAPKGGALAAWKRARVEALEDLVWALLNSDEFLVNH